MIRPEHATIAPDFTLRDTHGRDVRLSNVLQRGPAVLVFLRGLR